MQIALKPEQEKFILEKLQEGQYKNIDELLTLALQLLKEHDYKKQQLIELRKKIAEGTQQIRQGNVIDGETVFEQLQDKLERMEKS